MLADASVTSARIIVSTLACMSRSNLSAVYAPDAMWLMMYTFAADDLGVVAIRIIGDAVDKITPQSGV